MSFCSVPPLLSGQEGILSPNNNDDRNLWVLWGYKPNMGTISILCCCLCFWECKTYSSLDICLADIVIVSKRHSYFSVLSQTFSPLLFWVVQSLTFHGLVHRVGDTAKGRKLGGRWRLRWQIITRKIMMMVVMTKRWHIIKRLMMMVMTITIKWAFTWPCWRDFPFSHCCALVHLFAPVSRHHHHHHHNHHHHHHHLEEVGITKGRWETKDEISLWMLRNRLQDGTWGITFNFCFF